MSEAVKIAQKYFALSNKSNMDAIEKMFRPSTTYSSQNTGVFLGVEQILEMQRSFHASFKELKWDILSVEEERPGVVKFDFTLIGEKNNGAKVSISGIEYLIIYDGMIQHVEVRNK